MLPLSDVVALQRAVPSIRLDPVSRRAIRQEPLPTGTLIEGAAEILGRAEVEESATVTVTVRHAGGLVGLSEINARALRAALEVGT